VTGQLLTARQVAERLGVSPGALLRWTRAGKVPGVKLPSGAVRYVPEEIDEWIAASHVAGAAERGVSPARTDRARMGVSSSSSPARPLHAARNEEEHDGRP
jgi:excisionase family DNA binding protein